jgi:riboflavin kinase / FMN adenylyltransferase
MQVFRRAPPLSERRPSALTIGNFDGVHLGHQALLNELGRTATACGLVSCVLTFEPHPREYFASIGRGQAPVRVLSLRDKLDVLAGSRVQRVNIAHFNAKLAQMSAEDFIDGVLVNALQMRHLLIGDDFRFGAQRRGDLEMLLRHGSRKGFVVQAMATVSNERGRISSSAIRDALQRGQLDQVRALLGRPYTMSGHVIHGRKLGRTLGFPTLNLRVPFEKPALHGVFAVRVHGLCDQETAPQLGVASLGTRPAVETDGKPLLEVHVLDFSESVYGRLVQVEFISKLRDEANYPTLAALRVQIAEDARQARGILQAFPL